LIDGLVHIVRIIVLSYSSFRRDTMTTKTKRDTAQVRQYLFQKISEVVKHPTQDGKPAPAGRLVSKEVTHRYTPVEVECGKGHLFSEFPLQLLDGKWCPVCKHQTIADYNKELEEAAKMRQGRLSEAFQPGHPSWGCKNPDTHVRKHPCWECKEKDHPVFRASHLDVVLLRKWCPECFHSTFYKIETMAMIEHLEGECDSKYTYKEEPLSLQCKKRHRFSRTPMQILEDLMWCPTCDKELTREANRKMAAPLEQVPDPVSDDEGETGDEADEEDEEMPPASPKRKRDNISWQEQLHDMAEEKLQSVGSQLLTEKFERRYSDAKIQCRDKHVYTVPASWFYEADKIEANWGCPRCHLGPQYEENIKKAASERGWTLLGLDVVEPGQHQLQLPDGRKFNLSYRELVVLKMSSPFEDTSESRVEVAKRLGEERGAKLVSTKIPTDDTRTSWQCKRHSIYEISPRWREAVFSGVWCRGCGAEIFARLSRGVVVKRPKLNPTLPEPMEVIPIVPQSAPPPAPTQAPKPPAIPPVVQPVLPAPTQAPKPPVLQPAPQPTPTQAPHVAPKPVVPPVPIPPVQVEALNLFPSQLFNLLQLKSRNQSLHQPQLKFHHVSSPSNVGPTFSRRCSSYRPRED
jgi:hypothetical protein